MEILKKIWFWFVYSSNNPEKIALTLKAGIPFLVILNLGDAEVLGTAVDASINVLVGISTLIAGTVTAYGAIRKVVYSLPFFK